MPINKVWKMVLVIGIIFLFAGTGIASPFQLKIDKIFKNDQLPLIKGKTIYVDDDNTEGPWNGTLQYPYQFIQDGVDNASEGDTVIVFEGTYYENVKVETKSIKLFGNDKNKTIIDGREITDVIVITVDNVEISEFTIQNSENYSDGIRILYSNYNKIYNNIIINNFRGIFLDYDGIEKKGSNNNKIYNNIIKYNTLGITVSSGWFEGGKKSSANSINNNIISNNTDFGIFLSGNGNIISNNIISDNSLKYGFIYGGIGLFWASNNIILNNNFLNNNNGITLLWLTINCFLQKNNFFNNFCNAYFWNAFFNHWIKNFWDDWSGIGPYKIEGIFAPILPPIMINLTNYDWNPAKEPYDIYNKTISQNTNLKNGYQSTNLFFPNVLEQISVIQKIIKRYVQE
jgi:parallel beta-helix repeat protein